MPKATDKSFTEKLYVAAPIGFTQKSLPGYKTFLEGRVSNGSERVIASCQLVLRENHYGFTGNQD